MLSSVHINTTHASSCGNKPEGEADTQVQENEHRWHTTLEHHGSVELHISKPASGEGKGWLTNQEMDKNRFSIAATTGVRGGCHTPATNCTNASCKINTDWGMQKTQQQQKVDNWNTYRVISAQNQWLQKHFTLQNATPAPPVVGAVHGPEAALKRNKSDAFIHSFTENKIFGFQNRPVVDRGWK